jgi:carboxylesterase type B
MPDRTILFGNLGYQCSARLQAQRRMDKGVHAWRYRWMGAFPNQHIADDAGAWHGSEIPHVFGNIATNSATVQATSDQLKVSELMNSAWATFAKDPESGLLKLGWPLYNEKGTDTHIQSDPSVFLIRSTEDSLILLAEKNGPGATFAPGGKFDSQCNLIKNNIPQLP